MFAESCIWQINSCPYAICGLLRLWCDFHYDTLHSRTHSHWLKSINACTLEEIMTRVNLKIINNGDMFICWEDYWEQILALVLRALRTWSSDSCVCSLSGSQLRQCSWNTYLNYKLCFNKLFKSLINREILMSNCFWKGQCHQVLGLSKLTN